MKTPWPKNRDAKDKKYTITEAAKKLGVTRSALHEHVVAMKKQLL